MAKQQSKGKKETSNGTIPTSEVKEETFTTGTSKTRTSGAAFGQHETWKSKKGKHNGVKAKKLPCYIVIWFSWKWKNYITQSYFTK